MVGPSEVKDTLKRNATQIQRLATSKVAPVNSYSYDSITVPHKKKGGTGVLPDRKLNRENTTRHDGAQCYRILFKKVEMPELK